MKKKYRIVAGVGVVALIVSGCGGSAVKLAPIAGKWAHQSDQNQVWTYEFPSDKAVSFAIDRQRQKWPIKEIRILGSTIEIDVDGFLGQGPNQNSTIRVLIQGKDAIFVSSGLHPGMLFKKDG